MNNLKNTLGRAAAIAVGCFLMSCDDFGKLIVDSATALAGMETEEVRISGEHYIELDKGDPSDGFYPANGQLCVAHRPGCKSWIFSSGNDGQDKYFTPRLQLPPLAFLKRVEFTPYYPAGLNGNYGGDVWGSGSYKMSYAPTPDLSDPQTVAWENACHGPYAGKPVVYAISFIVLKAKQVDLGETFSAQPVTTEPCKPSDTGPAPTPPQPTQSGWSGGVKICNPSLSRIVATLHLEAHCAAGGTIPECTMNIDVPNLVFEPGGGAGVIAPFKTPQTYKPGPWVITGATLTTPDPLGELPGVPLARDLPGGVGIPLLDFTGGRCL